MGISATHSSPSCVQVLAVWCSPACYFVFRLGLTSEMVMLSKLTLEQACRYFSRSHAGWLCRQWKCRNSINASSTHATVHASSSGYGSPALAQLCMSRYK